MLYSTVEIKPRDNEWYVCFSDLEGQRHDEGHRPHPLGFYHYPKRMGKKKAFEALKKQLISQHTKKISQFTESLEKLVALEMKET